MRYRKYIKTVLEDPERLHPIAPMSEVGTRYLVKARRRESPGNISLYVTASDSTEATRKVEAGELPAIGLGWIVYDVQEVVA